MSKAEELLESLTVIEHEHEVEAKEVTFEIDPETRTISNVTGETVKLVQGDHKSTRFVFEMPRYINGHDMMLCNMVYIPYVNAEPDGRTQKFRKGVCTVADMQLVNEDTIKFTWLVTRNSTYYAGGLSFMVIFQCMEGERILYSWNAEPNADVVITAKLDSGETFEYEYIDIIEQWKSKVKAEFTAYLELGLDERAVFVKDRVKEELTHYLDGEIERQDDNIGSAVAIMNDTLNTFDDILKTEITDMDSDIDVLKARMDTFTKLEEGSTTGDAELADAHVSYDGTVYNNAGDAIRAQAKQAVGLANAPSLYSLDVVKEHLGLKEIYSGSLSYNHTNSEQLWKYVAKDVALPAGDYVILVRDLNLPETGYLAVNEDPSHHPFIEITKPGTYKFTVFDSDYSTGDNIRSLKLQVCEGTAVDVGEYYASGITIFGNEYIDAQAFPDEVIGLNKVVKKQIGTNLVDPSTIIDGYFVTSGGVLKASEPQYGLQYASDFIDIEGGATYVFYDTEIGGACIAFYDMKKDCILAINNATTDLRLHEMGGIVTAPEDARYLRISGELERKNIAMVSKGNVQIPFEAYTEYAPLRDLEDRVILMAGAIAEDFQAAESKTMNNSMFLTNKADSMTPGDTLEIETPTNAKWGYTIGVHCKLNEEFDWIRVGRGVSNPYCCAWIEIDSAYVCVYKYTTDRLQVDKIAHGLTIKDFLTCTIRANNDNTAKLVLVTGSGAFVEAIEWNASNGNIFIGTGSTLTDCELTYSLTTINEKLWIFGDSYFDMWTRKVTEYGFSNFLEDAYSGRSSQTALNALKGYLTYRTPEQIGWFMGMNDGDDDEIDSKYKAVIDEVVDICNEKGIELFVSTIPNVPERDHSYKNAYIKSLPVRVIDICHAVGADVNASWHSGLLSGDKVHPSDIGKSAIASYVINNLPDITR